MEFVETGVSGLQMDYVFSFRTNFFFFLLRIHFSMESLDKCFMVEVDIIHSFKDPEIIG